MVVTRKIIQKVTQRLLGEFHPAKLLWMKALAAFGE